MSVTSSGPPLSAPHVGGRRRRRPVAGCGSAGSRSTFSADASSPDTPGRRASRIAHSAGRKSHPWAREEYQQMSAVWWWSDYISWRIGAERRLQWSTVMDTYTPFSGQFRRQCMQFGKSACNFGGSTFRRPFRHGSACGLSKLVALLPNFMQIVGIIGRKNV